MLLCGEEVFVPAHLNFGKFMLNRLRKVNPEWLCLENCATGDKLSYSEFLQHAVSLSAALAQLGVGRGDAVVVAGEACLTFLPTGLAVILAGATYIPIELQCGRSALAHKLNLTKPNYVISTRLFWEAYSDIMKGLGFIKTFIGFEAIEGIGLCVETMVSRHVDVAEFEPAAGCASDVAMVVFSSGTTGLPKGVQLTHLNSIVECSVNIQWYNEYEKASKSLISQTIQTVFIPDAYLNNTTSYDFFMMTASICAGKTILYSEKVVNLKIIQDFQVDAMPTIPSIVEMILNLEEERYDLSSLKLVFTAGSTLCPPTAKAFREKYPNIKLINIYGASEVGLIATAHSTIAFKDTNEEPDTKTSLVGNACPGVTIKVVDVETRATLGLNQRGEICVRSPRLMKGYLGATSSCLDEQGFYLTGDLGYYDDQKRLYLVDRMKEIFSYLSCTVCPAEVELVLLQHAAVREAAVVGAPAGAAGEHAAAFVVLRPGATVTEAELQDYVAKELTWHMHLLGGVRFLTELPRNPRGKLLRRQLKEMLIEDRKE